MTDLRGHFAEKAAAVGAVVTSAADAETARSAVGREDGGARSERSRLHELKTLRDLAGASREIARSGEPQMVTINAG